MRPLFVAEASTGSPAGCTALRLAMAVMCSLDSCSKDGASGSRGVARIQCSASEFCSKWRMRRIKRAHSGARAVCCTEWLKQAHRCTAVHCRTWASMAPLLASKMSTNLREGRGSTAAWPVGRAALLAIACCGAGVSRVSPRRRTEGEKSFIPAGDISQRCGGPGCAPNALSLHPHHQPSGVPQA